ncbi:importin-5-like isoform X2 [Corticium candelabrum]|uniref:importin-5-like isoform X2 n=1 Tax=Corticium candelabrum TaxID=121492 RepID=UPI002E268FF4|nr:importin-5-like isoform X2 [Corticium candelabrum]
MVRQLAAVLTRRIAMYVLDQSEGDESVSKSLLNAVKEKLLVLVESETNKVIRKKLCDAISEWARYSQDDDGVNEWPDVLKFLFAAVSSTLADMKECALTILTNFPGIFGDQESRYRDVIKQMLVQSLNSESTKVQDLAVRAMVAYINSLDENSLKGQFADLLPLAAQIVERSAAEQSDDEVLKSMIELAENSTKMLRQHLLLLFDVMLKISAATEIDDSYRQLGLEFIVTVAEEGSAMVRHHIKHLDRIVPQVLAFMLDLEDSPNWSKFDEEVDDEDCDSNAIAGETALDRLACALGGKVVLPYVTAAVAPMMANSDWRYRHAAIMAISTIGEGCHSQMLAILSQLVDAILPFLQDPHPRVRFAACNCLGQMAVDFAKDFQKNFHTKVLPALLHVMGDVENPRVQGHAAAAVSNFVENCPKKKVVPYLEMILCTIQTLMANNLPNFSEKNSQTIIEQLITTLATVADTAEEHFVPFYHYFMPNLKFLLQSLTAKEHRALRGRVIECISLIGLAVGRETFLPDADDVLVLLIKVQTDREEFDDDDPQVTYLISAWARMCKILQKEFLPYLPVVMPHILKTAKIEPEVALLDVDDDDGLDENDWESITLADQRRFGIKTGGLEDKCTACQMLVCYARDLEEGFVDYVEEVAVLMMSLLKFILHEGVRLAAADSLPCLLKCARPKGDEFVCQLWSSMFSVVQEALDKEPDKDVVAGFLDSLCQCVKEIGKQGLTREQTGEIMKVLQVRLGEHFKSVADIQEKRREEDYDEGVEEDLQFEGETNEMLLSKVADVIHSLFGVHGDAVLPYFNPLCPIFALMLGPERSPAEHQWSLCVFDDILEFAGSSAGAYQEYFVRPMLEYILDKQPTVRQAASYGFGMMAQFCGQEFEAVCREALPRLCQVCSDPNSRVDSASRHAMENAVAAVVKMCQHKPAIVPLDEVLPLFLNWLPVTEDSEEAEHIYSYFCQLIASNHPCILGAGHSNLPKILAIMAEALNCGVLDDETKGICEAMSTIIKQIRMSGDIWSACLEQLTEEQRTVVLETTTTLEG